MKNWKDYLYFFYITAMIVMSIILLFNHVNTDADAGIIRKILVSPDKPGIVRLALKRNTTISFLSRPEKVVPGAPQATEINFIGKDLNIRPLQGNLGNLTVYTKSERLVLLLQMGNESNYDDVVTIIPSFSSRGYNLSKDTYK